MRERETPFEGSECARERVRFSRSRSSRELIERGERFDVTSMYTTIACKTDATRARPRGLDLTARLRATVSVTAVPPRTRSPIRPDHSARVRSPRRLRLASPVCVSPQAQRLQTQ